MDEITWPPGSAELAPVTQVEWRSLREWLDIVERESALKRIKASVDSDYDRVAGRWQEVGFAGEPPMPASFHSEVDRP